MRDTPEQHARQIERKIERKLSKSNPLNAFTGISMTGFLGWCIVMPCLSFLFVLSFFKERLADLPPAGKALIIFICFCIGAFNAARYLKKEHEIMLSHELKRLDQPDEEEKNK